MTDVPQDCELLMYNSSRREFAEALGRIENHLKGKR